MPFSSHEMVDGTQVLSDYIDSKTNDNEYDYRNYCGRAYYTVYHLVVEYLDDEHGYRALSTSNKSYNNMGTHKRLNQFLNDHINIPSTNYHKDYKRLALRLKALVGYRVHADYLFDKSLKNTDYHQAKKQAEAIIKLVSVLA